MRGDTVYVVFGISPYIEVLNDCTVIGTTEESVYFGSEDMRSYAHFSKVFLTYKEAVDEAVSTAKDEIVELKYNISVLTNLIEDLTNKQNEYRRSQRFKKGR